MARHFTRADVERSFPAAFVDRAEDYHLERRVKLRGVEADGTHIEAEVSGTRIRPYTVAIDIFAGDDGPEFHGVCACPQGFNCKHVVATLLEVLSSNRLRKRKKPLDSGTPADATDAMTRWIDRVSRTTPDEGQADSSDLESRRCLAYVLDSLPTAEGRIVALRVVSAYRLKKGGYSGEQPYDASLVTRRLAGRYVTVLDRRVLAQLLALGTKVPGGAHHLDPSFAGALLPTLLETGRSHWRSLEGPALRPGDPREAEIFWELDEDGLQRLRIVAGDMPFEFLPSEPPFYVDVGRGLVGALRTEVPPAIAARVLDAPALPPEDAERVREGLLDKFAEVGLPLPLAVEVEEARDVHPWPCLRLLTMNFKSWAAGRLGSDEAIDLARLEFDYATTRVAANDPRRRVAVRAGGVVRRITRDDEFETRAFERLRQLGFVEATMVADVPTWSEPGREMRRLGALALPGTAEMVAAHRGHPWQPPASPWSDFVLKTLPELEKEGWQIDFDPNFRHNYRSPEFFFAGVGKDRPRGDRAAPLVSGWFDISLGIEIDGERVNLLPAVGTLLREWPEGFSIEGIQDDDPPWLVPLPDGRKAVIPATRMREILSALVELFDPRAIDAEGRVRVSRGSATAVSTLADAGWTWEGSDELLRMRQTLARMRTVEPGVPPEGLCATLRDYQRAGLAWMEMLRDSGLGGVLADDMGLGKTIQALALLLREKREGRADLPSLVVAPTSVVGNWRREAARFAPDLRVSVLHGPDRDAALARLDDVDLAITSYALLPRDGDALLSQPFHYVILDEAQRIKNFRAKAAGIARGIGARHRLCLTGTPIENNLGELFSLFEFVNPGFLGSQSTFSRVFRGPIERKHDEGRRLELARRVGPLILRRTKDQVARELPPKTEIARTVELTGAQRDLYETLRLAMHARVQEAVRRRGLERSQILILEALLKLRQACCDPRLVKLDAARRVDGSVKLELLMEMLPDLLADGRRVLLFSQFTSMLELIARELDARKIRYVTLTGQTKDRDAVVDAFQNGQAPLFLISLKAGGVGLNLTAADTVIHYDPWWNPAAEDQATDRAHRIGQDRPVFVYRLLTSGTVEEKILELQERKRALVAGIVGEGAVNAASLDADDLDALFAPLL